MPILVQPSAMFCVASCSSCDMYDPSQVFLGSAEWFSSSGFPPSLSERNIYETYQSMLNIKKVNDHFLATKILLCNRPNNHCTSYLQMIMLINRQAWFKLRIGKTGDDRNKGTGQHVLLSCTCIFVVSDLDICRDVFMGSNNKWGNGGGAGALHPPPSSFMIWLQPLSALAYEFPANKNKLQAL